MQERLPVFGQPDRAVDVLCAMRAACHSLAISIRLPSSVKTCSECSGGSGAGRFTVARHVPTSWLPDDCFVILGGSHFARFSEPLAEIEDARV
jgi:hypothetical protein